MRFRFAYSAVILLVAVFLASCNAVDTTVSTNSAKPPSPVKPATAPATINDDGARRITTSELEALIKEGKAFVVDVRNQDMYDQGHIPGSRLMPAGEIMKYVKELPRDKTIVTYCS